MYRGSLHKDYFPQLLKKTLIGQRMSANLQSGFATTGIFPTDREVVLKVVRKKKRGTAPKLDNDQKARM